MKLREWQRLTAIFESTSTAQQGRTDSLGQDDALKVKCVVVLWIWQFACGPISGAQQFSQKLVVKSAAGFSHIDQSDKNMT